MITPSDFSKSQNFYKRNYVDVLKIITPDIYLNSDIQVSGVVNDPINHIINSHILALDNISQILPVSATTNFSDINNVSGLSRFFIKQNNLTKIDSFSFEKDILFPLNKTYSDFATSADFASYISGTFLPTIPLQTAVDTNLAQSTASAYDNTSSGTHEYLIKKLSWFYFLNTAAPTGGTFAPSTFVSEKLSNIYRGDSLGLVDGILGFQEYLFKNRSSFSGIDNRIYPSDFASGTAEFVSGTQQLDKLSTLLETIYSEEPLNVRDTLVNDALDDFIAAGTLLVDEKSNGPFEKLLRAISYSVADTQNQINKLDLLYDIEGCPKEFLPLLAELIGLKLVGHDEERWRLQLRQAVSLYKAAGTKKSIQLSVDSFFGKGSFDVSSNNIFELYESYLPNLIYYALATDSAAFKEGFTSWTPTAAKALLVNDYSFDSIDINIRYAVDYILRRLVQLHPDHFTLGNTPFPHITDIGGSTDPNFVFNYRGRDFPIPPWEEERYYETCIVTLDFLDTLSDILCNFGISSNLRDGIRNYYHSFSLSSLEDIHVHNRWNLFTSSIQSPPNFSNVLADPSTKNIEFLSLWSGKSSHFAVPFVASSFDFTKLKSQDPDYALALNNLSTGLIQLVPLHAIPNITLSLSDSDTYLVSTLDDCGSIKLPLEGILDGSTPIVINRGVSGVNASSGNQVFRRSEVDTLQDAYINSSSAPVTVPRNSIRRRNFKRLLPRKGIYTRSGFSMPSPYLYLSGIDCSSCWTPLGYIPSAGSFQTISEYSSIPSVYSICENLTSSSVFSGVSVSTTMLSRGAETSISGCSKFITRGETPEIVGFMAKFLDEIAYLDASSVIEDALNSTDFYSIISAMGPQIDLYQASANQTVLSLSSFDEYLNFKFGRGLQKLYNDYTDAFSKHLLDKASLTSSSVPNIFSQTYGPLLFNSQELLEGSALQTSSNLIASSLVSSLELNTSNVFSSGSTNVGTFIASDTSHLYIETKEFRNPHIISGVELIIPSGAPTSNSFSITRLNKVYESKLKEENYLINNTILKQKTTTSKGLPRVRFDLKTYHTNFFLPEHDFELKVKVAALDAANTFQGKIGFGCWIHTDNENEDIWSWSPNNKWVKNTFSEFSGVGGSGKVLSLSHIFNHGNPTVEFTQSEGRTIFTADDGSCQTSDATANILEGYFLDYTLNFDTKNFPIAIPNSYYKNSEQVHHNTQNYIVEIFAIPSMINQNTSLVIDSISIIDLTQNSRASIETSFGNISLDKDKLLTTLKYFNSVGVSGAATRDAVNSSGSFEVSGGSRLNYRINPYWVSGSSPITSFEQVSSLDIII